MLSLCMCTGKHSIAAWDPLRITVGVEALGLTGNHVSSILEQDHSVVAELATRQVSHIIAKPRCGGNAYGAAEGLFLAVCLMPSPLPR